MAMERPYKLAPFPRNSFSVPKSITTWFLFLCLTLYAGASPFQYSQILPLDPPPDSQRVYTGLERLRQSGFDLIPEGDIAIVVNDGSITQDRQHILDILEKEYSGKLAVILKCSNIPGQTPHTGFIPSSVAGKKLIFFDPQHQVLNTTGLDSCTLMLIDIQDLGIRTSFPFEILTKVMALAAKYQLPCYLLDRPNPLNAQTVQGFLDQDFHLPQRYGLTLAELALFLNEEQRLTAAGPVKLNIVPMANYQRSFYFDDTGLSWNLGDPRFLTVEQLLLYCGLKFATTSNLNIGQGTFYPYQILSAPWLNPEAEGKHLKSLEISGLRVKPLKIIPREIGAYSEEEPLYADQACPGIRLIITERLKCNPVFNCAYIVGSIAQRYPHHFTWLKIDQVDAYFGSHDFRIAVDMGADLRRFRGLWEAQRTPYQKKRLNYLLYAP